ncbi:Fe(2+) transporter [Gonapodya sp. JEL0774]|nr:Fe(2+) transporter [Gonapodya sp. JEL0774]
MNKRIIYVTNNSSKSRKNYVGKFAKLGFPAEPDNIFGSAYAAAYYLKNMLKFPEDKKVYVIGMQGIVDELAEMGIQTAGAGLASKADNAPLSEDEFENGSLGPDESIGAVLLGFDSQINYRKYAKAYTYLTVNKGKVHFLATNEDRTYPISGSIYPGTGSLLAALIHSVNRRPDAVLGKPSQNMMNTILERFHLDPSKTCMVGDRLDTDIAFGKLGGLHTLLVMTGVTSPAERDGGKGAVSADFWIESPEKASVMDLLNNQRTLSSTTILTPKGVMTTAAVVGGILNGIGSASTSDSVNSPGPPRIVGERHGERNPDIVGEDFAEDYESLPTSSVAVHLAAGAFAGVAEHSIMFPLDAIKTRMQFITPSPQAVYSSLANAVTRISSTEGMYALWRGVSSVVVGAGPAHALQFATYEMCKEHFEELVRRRTRERTFRSLDESRLLHASHALAATAGTVMHEGLMTPFDEGLASLYVSLPTTLLMAIPFQSIHFTTYEYLRQRVNPEGKYDPKSHVIAGALAGGLASLLTNPLDVAKTLLQTRGSSSDPEIRRVRGALSAGRIIWERDGLRGAMRGSLPRLLTHMPSTAISWSVYEFCKWSLNRRSSKDL